MFLYNPGKHCNITSLSWKSKKTKLIMYLEEKLNNYYDDLKSSGHQMFSLWVHDVGGHMLLVYYTFYICCIFIPSVSTMCVHENVSRELSTLHDCICILFSRNQVSLLLCGAVGLYTYWYIPNAKLTYSIIIYVPTTLIKIHCIRSTTCYNAHPSWWTLGVYVNKYIHVYQ